MANVCASGFGTSTANGTWVDQSTVFNGHPTYMLNGRYCYFPTDGNGWYLSGAAKNNGADVLYYDSSGANLATPDLVVSWSLNAGITPAGTVTAGSCAAAAAASKWRCLLGVGS